MVDDHAEVVESLIFMGSKIAVSGECRGEMNRWLALGRTAMSGLTKIWKDKDVTKQTKRRLVNDLVFPVAMYGCKSWTVKNKGRTLTVLVVLWFLWF